MEETIDLREYFYILKKKFWVIALTAIIFGLISGLVSFFVLKPVYQSSTTLIVNKEVENEVTQMTTTDDLNYAQKLAVTYGEIIKSRTVITSTIKELGLDLSYEDLEMLDMNVKRSNCNTRVEYIREQIKKLNKDA